MINQKATEQKTQLLLTDLEGKAVWMMTNGLSDKLNPYSGNNWAELRSCNADVSIDVPELSWVTRLTRLKD